MQLLRALASAVLLLCAAPALAQIPPVYYPPDGTYFIYNVQFQRFFNNKDQVNTEGNPIIGWPLTAAEKFTNQQFNILNTAPDGQRITIRVLGTEEVNSMGGFVHIDNSDFKLVNSASSDFWSLQPVPEEALQFMIIEEDLAITLDDGTTSNANDIGAQLSAETIDLSALNQRWIFVPVDQIDTFDQENNVPLNG